MCVFTTTTFSSSYKSLELTVTEGMLYSFRLWIKGVVDAVMDYTVSLKNVLTELHVRWKHVCNS